MKMNTERRDYAWLRLERERLEDAVVCGICGCAVLLIVGILCGVWALLGGDMEHELIGRAVMLCVGAFALWALLVELRGTLAVTRELEKVEEEMDLEGGAE